MKRFLLVLLVAMGSYSIAQEKRMCITIDDLPMVRYGVKTQGHEAELTEGLIQALKKHNAPAIGYVNENKLYINGQLDEQRVSYLESWLAGGFDLGNHTFSHLNYHRVTFEEFTDNVERGEQITKPLAAKYGKEIKFFRHPYLRSGLTKESTEKLKLFLKDHGYIESPVTIDNEEYLFALAFARAYKKEDVSLMKKIGEAYLSYMDDQIDYYEKASSDLLGRNMDHTLLIHANYLNAVYLDALLTICEKKGYTFVSQEEVLKDPAYSMEVTRFDDWGISWIHRWGLSEGLEGEFFQGEAKTPDFIIDLTK